MSSPVDRDALKRAAGEAAVQLIEDGMIVGLGTGSTASMAIEALAVRVQQGLQVLCIPTSERSDALARAGGITLTTFGAHPRIDITIDGADEIDRTTLNLIKGLGGALLREKIVAAASDRLVIVADPPKLVDRLGAATPVPVEVVAFGWEATNAHLQALCPATELRLARDGSVFITDGGNVIIDCNFGALDDAAATDRAIRDIVGVIETGLFIGRASLAIIADPAGVQRLSRP